MKLKLRTKTIPRLLHYELSSSKENSSAPRAFPHSNSALTVTSPVLSDIWACNIFSPRDVSIRSELPKDLSSEFSPSYIPDIDVYGAPPNETEKFDVQDEETCSSGFSKHFSKSVLLGMADEIPLVGDTTSNQDVPQNVLQFCADLEAYFDVSWIGSMQIEDCSARYLEISMTERDGMKRVVNLNRRKCAQVAISMSVVPRRMEETWKPTMIYQDFNPHSETELTLMGTELDLQRLIIKGTCSVKKNGDVKKGTFRLVRMTLPQRAIEFNSDRRRSAIIEGASGLSDRQPTFPVAYDFGGSSMSILGSENDIVFLHSPRSTC